FRDNLFAAVDAFTLGGLDQGSLSFALADELHFRALADRRLRDFIGKLMLIFYRLAVKAHDQIAALQSGFGRRAIRLNIVDQRALGSIEAQAFRFLRSDLTDDH